MKIIAFDSSLARSAYALRGDGGRWWWAAESFIKPSDKAFPDLRFAQWREWAASALRDELPDVVIYEVPTTHGQGSGLAQIMLMMTLRELCAVRRIPAIGIYPAHLKNHICKNGKADKAEMMAAVKTRVPLYQPQFDAGGDIADSIAMVLWYLDGAPPSQSAVKKAAKKARKKEVAL